MILIFRKSVGHFNLLLLAERKPIYFRQGGIESIANDYSLRATPSYVAFGYKQRYNQYVRYQITKFCYAFSFRYLLSEF